MPAPASTIDLPPPPEVSFASDNTAGVDPVVMEALAAANTPAALAYGADDWSGRLTVRFGELLDRDVVVLPCWGGTGANVVGLASLLQPWQAVVCTEHAHIATDECGAPTRFTGSTLLTVPADRGKLRPTALEGFGGSGHDVHHVQPAVVSVSQSTELGSVYGVEELAAIGDAAGAAGLLVHLDGARLANAVAATGADLRTMVGDTGVDVMTFGVTKNGAMYGEAVVFLRPELATGAAFHQKQSAQLPSKARFVSAQLLALLDGDRWIDNAAHANRMASLLASALSGVDGVELVGAPEANAVFARLPDAAIAPLQEWSFFWRWPGASLVRWMTSFATTEADVDRFVAGVRTVVEAQR